MQSDDGYPAVARFEVMLQSGQSSCPIRPGLMVQCHDMAGETGRQRNGNSAGAQGRGSLIWTCCCLGPFQNCARLPFATNNFCPPRAVSLPARAPPLLFFFLLSFSRRLHVWPFLRPLCDTCAVLANLLALARSPAILVTAFSSRSGRLVRRRCLSIPPRLHARPGAPRCFGYRNLNPESTALPMQSPAVSRSRHLTVRDGVSVCGHASASGRHTSGLCIEYLFPSDTPPVGPRLNKVRAHTPAPACTPRCRCFGYRTLDPDSTAVPMQSPAV